MMHVAPEQSSHPLPARVPGLDLLRLLAIAAVSFHHLLSIGHDDWGPQCAGVNLGDVGVGLFCAVAGTLAAQPAALALSPWQWLRRRAARILPAYWIVLTVSFLLAALAHYKPITPALLLAQFTAVAPFFYDTSRLVNQSTWFVGLILLCYVLFFLARILRVPRLGLLIALVLAACAVVHGQGQNHLAVQVLTFCLAAYLTLLAPAPATPARRAARAWPILATGAAFLLAAAVLVCTARPGSHTQPVLPGVPGLPGVCLLALGLVLAGAPTEPRVLRVPAGLVYEYFLVHGIFFVAAARAFPAHPIAAGVLLAVPAATLAAGVLHYLVRLLPTSRDRKGAVLS
jgi:peptidoglycan/LPS O-acetylase OafA/YrhL